MDAWVYIRRDRDHVCAATRRRQAMVIHRGLSGSCIYIDADRDVFKNLIPSRMGYTLFSLFLERGFQFFDPIPGLDQG